MIMEAYSPNLGANGKSNTFSIFCDLDIQNSHDKQNALRKHRIYLAEIGGQSF